MSLCSGELFLPSCPQLQCYPPFTEGTVLQPWSTAAPWELSAPSWGGWRWRPSPGDPSVPFCLHIKKPGHLILLTDHYLHSRRSKRLACQATETSNICKRLLLHLSQGHFTSPGRALLCQHSGQGQPAASRHVAGCAQLAPRPRCLGLGIQAVNKAIVVIHVLFSAFHHDNVVSELCLDGRVCVHGLVHAAHRQGKRCLLEWSHHGASGHPAQVSLQEGTVGVKL